MRWKFTGDTLTISDTGDMENYHGGARRNGSPAPWFDFNRAIKKIIINDGVTTIGDWAFDNCTQVIEMILSTSVTTIGAGAFNYCRSLKEVVLPNGVTKICNEAFAGCFSLTKLKISASVVSIDAWAFNACESLREVTIPINVMEIGEWIFAACFVQKIHYPARRGFEENLSKGNNAKLIPY